MGRAIVTNEDFSAYVCDSAATRPSSQITLDRLVIIGIRTFAVELISVTAVVPLRAGADIMPVAVLVTGSVVDGQTLGVPVPALTGTRLL